MNRFNKALAVMLLLGAAPASFAACNVSVTSLSFGDYDVFDPMPNDSMATIQVSCIFFLRNPDVMVSIGPSQTSGGFYPRQMRSASGDRLNYNLFIDPGATIIWGDGVAGGEIVRLKNMKNKTATLQVYGRLPAGQDVGVGSYTDSVTVFLDW